MKTTIELPDDLLIEAKQVAARRRTTLREMITRSLRREIGAEAGPMRSPGECCERGELGLPVLKKRRHRVTPEQVKRIGNQIESEEVQRAAGLK